MERITRDAVLAFNIILFSKLDLHECRYLFPVLTTKSCPTNEAQWLERSSTLNCNETNGYMCIPNGKITVLLEFCYHKPRTIIPNGSCLVLHEHSFAVDDFKCRRFSFGCPYKTYFSNEIYKHQNCISIGKGCFLAEPFCNWTTTTKTTTATSKYSTEENIKPGSNEYVWPWLWIFGGIFICGSLLTIILSAIDNTYKRETYSKTPKKSQYGEKSEKSTIQEQRSLLSKNH